MSLVTNNFLLAGIVATLLIIVYYCYVNYLMKRSNTDDDGDGDPPTETPLSVSLVDYGKKFGMFYILSLGLVFVGKKYLVSSDALESSTGGSLSSNLLDTKFNNSSTVDGDTDSSSGGFFSNLFKSGKQSVSNEQLDKLSEVKLKNTKKMENFKTGQPQF